MKVATVKKKLIKTGPTKVAVVITEKTRKSLAKLNKTDSRASADEGKSLQKIDDSQTANETVESKADKKDTEVEGLEKNPVETQKDTKSPCVYREITRMPEAKSPPNETSRMDPIIRIKQHKSVTEECPPVDGIRRKQEEITKISLDTDSSKLKRQEEKVVSKEDSRIDPRIRKQQELSKESSKVDLKSSRKQEETAKATSSIDRRIRQEPLHTKEFSRIDPRIKKLGDKETLCVNTQQGGSRVDPKIRTGQEEKSPSKDSRKVGTSKPKKMLVPKEFTNKDSKIHESLKDNSKDLPIVDPRIQKRQEEELLFLSRISRFVDPAILRRQEEKLLSKGSVTLGSKIETQQEKSLPKDNPIAEPRIQKKQEKSPAKFSTPADPRIQRKDEKKIPIADSRIPERQQEKSPLKKCSNGSEDSQAASTGQVASSERDSANSSMEIAGSNHSAPESSAVDEATLDVEPFLAPFVNAIVRKVTGDDAANLNAATQEIAPALAPLLDVIVHRVSSYLAASRTPPILTQISESRKSTPTPLTNTTLASKPPQPIPAPDSVLPYPSSEKADVSLITSSLLLSRTSVQTISVSEIASVEGTGTFTAREKPKTVTCPEATHCLLEVKHEPTTIYLTDETPEQKISAPSVGSTQNAAPRASIGTSLEVPILPVGYAKVGYSSVPVSTVTSKPVSSNAELPPEAGSSMSSAIPARGKPARDPSNMKTSNAPLVGYPITRKIASIMATSFVPQVIGPVTDTASGPTENISRTESLLPAAPTMVPCPYATKTLSQVVAPIQPSLTPDSSLGTHRPYSESSSSRILTAVVAPRINSHPTTSTQALFPCFKPSASAPLQGNPPIDAATSTSELRISRDSQSENEVSRAEF